MNFWVRTFLKGDRISSCTSFGGRLTRRILYQNPEKTIIRRSPRQSLSKTWIAETMWKFTFFWQHPTDAGQIGSYSISNSSPHDADVLGQVNYDRHPLLVPRSDAKYHIRVGTMSRAMFLSSLRVCPFVPGSGTSKSYHLSHKFARRSLGSVFERTNIVLTFSTGQC